MKNINVEGSTMKRHEESLRALKIGRWTGAVGSKWAPGVFSGDGMKA